MVKRRIGATASAMIVALQLGSPLAAEPTVEQLDEIRLMLAENDVAALRSYLERNPGLLEGDSQLAVLLRQFLLESRHLPNYLSDSPLSDTLGPTEQGSDAGDDPDDNGSY
jgi:hypothetical protein